MVTANVHQGDPLFPAYNVVSATGPRCNRAQRVTLQDTQQILHCVLSCFRDITSRRAGLLYCRGKGMFDAEYNSATHVEFTRQMPTVTGRL
jgi:hypothetical protein